MNPHPNPHPHPHPHPHPGGGEGCQGHEVEEGDGGQVWVVSAVERRAGAEASWSGVLAAPYETLWRLPWTRRGGASWSGGMERRQHARGETRPLGVTVRGLRRLAAWLDDDALRSRHETNLGVDLAAVYTRPLWRSAAWLHGCPTEYALSLAQRMQGQRMQRQAALPRGAVGHPRPTRRDGLTTRRKIEAPLVNTSCSTRRPPAPPDLQWVPSRQRDGDATHAGT